jgi:glutamyl-tRNA synthetase
LRDLAGQGSSPTEVLSLLAGSVNLARPGETIDPGQLVDRFDPDLLPRSPWRM